MFPGVSYLSPSVISLGSSAVLASRPWLWCSPLLKSWHLFLLAYFQILTLPELWYYISGIGLPSLSLISDLDLTQFSMLILSQVNGNLFYFVTHFHPDYHSIYWNISPCCMPTNHVPTALFYNSCPQRWLKKSKTKGL